MSKILYILYIVLNCDTPALKKQKKNCDIQNIATRDWYMAHAPVHTHKITWAKGKKLITRVKSRIIQLEMYKSPLTPLLLSVHSSSSD